MENKEIPPGTYVREDGCICPIETAQKPVSQSLYDTCPYDPRFPNQNQTYHCYYSFVDYQRCARLLGDYPGCKIFYTCYRSLCPSQWYEKWYEQMEQGIFPRKIYPPQPIIIPDPKKMATIFSEKEEPPEEDIC